MNKMVLFAMDEILRHDVPQNDIGHEPARVSRRWSYLPVPPKFHRKPIRIRSG